MRKNKLFLGLIIFLLIVVVSAIDKPFNIKKPTSNMTITINSEYSNLEGGWLSDTAITSGLSDLGTNSYVTIFQMGTTLYLIGGEQSLLYGYNWSGSAWQTDSSILSGLSTENFAAPKAFQINGNWYLLIGQQDGTFSGYHRSGSTWTANSTVSAGLGDIGDYSTLTVFEMNNTVYLISGEEVGGFYGFNWNGSGWDQNNTINTSLSIGDWGSTPSAFQKDGEFYLISGDATGRFHAKIWQTNAWSDYNAIETGLSDIGAYSAPTVFHHQGIWHIIAGEEDGVLTGFRTYETKVTSEGVNISASETNVGDVGCNYTLYFDGTNTTNPVVVSSGYHNYTYLTSGCDNFTEEMRTVFVNATSSIENVSTLSVSNQTAIINWDTMLSGNSTIDYGTSINLGNLSTNTSVTLGGHQVSISNLASASLYYFNVTSCYASGYCAESGPYNFSTFDNCRKLYNSYTIQSNISYSGGGVCFEVMNNSITLNCSNYPVRGTIIGTALSTQNYNSLNIIDCAFRNFSTGITATNVSTLTLTNSSVIESLGYDYYFDRSDVVLTNHQSMFTNNQNISILSSTFNSSTAFNFSNQFMLNINDSTTNTNVELSGTTNSIISNSVFRNITIRGSSNNQISTLTSDMITLNNGTIQLTNSALSIVQLNIATQNTNFTTLTTGLNNISLVAGTTLTLTNTTIGLMQIGTTTSSITMENSNISLFTSINSNLTLINSTIIDLSLTNTTANFTEFTNITRQLNTSGTSTIDGIAQFLNLSLSGQLTRFYPIYIINYSGLPEVSKNLTIIDNQTTLWSGSTGSGYAILNLTYNTSNYNLSYNISLPDVSINTTIGGVELLTKTPLNLSSDISPPNITEWQPQGTVYDTSTSLRLTTSEWAACRYYMTNGTNYYDMNGTFDEPGLSHTVYVGGLSNGAQTYYIKCIDRSNRISGEFTHNFTINAAGSSEGGGGGGGSITTVPNPSASKKWIDVKSSTENIMSINNDEIAFTNLTFVLNKNTSSVELTVESLKDTETIVSNSTLYKILEISEKDIEDTDYESVSIKFKVPRSWITANSSSASHIKLYKYTTKWIQLPTELIGQRSGYYQYQATSVSFSKFAIVSITPQVRQTEAESEQEEIEVIQEPVEQEPNAEPEQEAPQTHKKEISKIFVIIIFLVVISAFVGAIIGYKKYDHMNSMKNIEKYISHQKQKTKSITKEHHHTDLENFVKNCKSRGISREFVKKALLDAGWPEDIVDYYLVKYL